MQTFATWLQDEHGIAPSDEMRVAMYAHAANGGIKIDRTAYTGVEGLYACGEATGGMHGADRIGGLSSANGIVFGRIAGASAARAALDTPEADAPVDDALPEHGIATAVAERLTRCLKHTMSAYCMINRTDAGLSKALQELESLQDEAMSLHSYTPMTAKSQPSPAYSRKFSWHRKWSKPCAGEPKVSDPTIERTWLDTYLTQNTTNRYPWVP